MHFDTVIGKDISAARHWLEQGEVVAMPTETVYGLAGNALDADAVVRIFTVKNRPHFDPLIIHVFAVDEVEKYVEHIPEVAFSLMRAFMPGPLTLLLPKKPVVPDLVTSGLDNVAIRVPAHPLALELLKSLPFPLAAPSANPFGYVSPTTAQHVADQLNWKIPYILDGGPSKVGLESTIIGFEENAPVVHRIGGLALEEIEKITGRVHININNSSNPSAPGMLQSHYAPHKKLLFGSDANLAALSGIKVGVIAFNTYLAGFDKSDQVLLSQSGDLNEAAKNLFATMRKLDSADIDLIYATVFPAKGLGLAINDRLRRAAS